jgi:hypothetical protein
MAYMIAIEDIAQRGIQLQCRCGGACVLSEKAVTYGTCGRYLAASLVATRSTWKLSHSALRGKLKGEDVGKLLIYFLGSLLLLVYIYDIFWGS